MDIERTLVSKVVSTGQLETVISRGITADHFADDQCRNLYLDLLHHQRKYKSAMSVDAFRALIESKQEYRDFEFEHVSDALEYVVDQFIVVIKRRLANDAVIELAKACEDPERASKIDLEFLEASRKLATVVPHSQIARFSDMDKRIEEYERDKAAGKTVGIPFGFPSLDEWTGGIQPHEMVTVAGFSGLGKSTLLAVLAFNAYIEGYTPLYISLEMERRAILRKFDAMAASIDYTKLKHLNLPDEQLDNWRKVAEKVRKATNEIPVIDNIRGCTPDHVFAETVRHKPDLVVVDYIGLMRSSHPSHRSGGIWQTITEITQDLKQNARTLGIPILAAAQTNRAGGKDGAELDNIGYSLSIVQDSDIVVGLFADDTMKEEKEIEIRLNKNRDGRLGKFRAVWNYEEMLFRQKTMADKFGRQGTRAEESRLPDKDLRQQEAEDADLVRELPAVEPPAAPRKRNRV